MINYLWVGRNANREIDGFIVFSAWNDPKGDNPFAQDLARTINDPDENAGKRGTSTYVVTCHIKPQEDLFDYRYFTLNLRAAEEGNISYSRLLSGGEKCTPVNPSVGTIHIITAMTSPYKLVMENYRLDGYFATIHRIAVRCAGPPYAFNNSRNRLEDTLGVIAALSVSEMDLLDDKVVAVAVDGDKEISANAQIDVKRLGGRRWILVPGLVPVVFSAGLLIYQFYASFKIKNQPGGGLVNGEHPEHYMAESILAMSGKRMGDDSSIKRGQVEQECLIS